jgi:hypothetical protein
VDIGIEPVTSVAETVGGGVACVVLTPGNDVEPDSLYLGRGAARFLGGRGFFGGSERA